MKLLYINADFDDEWLEECRRCEKTRKVKKVII